MFTFAFLWVLPVLLLVRWLRVGRYRAGKRVDVVVMLVIFSVLAIVSFSLGVWNLVEWGRGV